MFFFDGEKIQSIADENNENKYIKSSFDTLLGLDLVNQLQKDIGFVLYREAKKKKDNEKKVESKNNSMTQEKLKYEMLKTELVEFAELRNNYENYKKLYKKSQHLENYESMIRFATHEMRERDFDGSELQSLLFLQEILEEKIHILDVNIKEQSESIKLINNDFLLHTEKFEKVGGNYYEKNKEIGKKESEMISKISVSEKEILDLCSTTLPFSLIPKQLDEIKKQMESDQKLTLLNYEKEIFEKNNKKISSALTSKSFLPQVSMDIKKTINSELIKSLKQEIDENIVSEIFFDWSPAQMGASVSVYLYCNYITVKEIRSILLATRTQPSVHT